MSLEELRREYEREVIGEGIFQVVEEFVSSVTVGRYDPRVYGGAASWDEALEDLVQSFVLDVLLDEGQLEYALFVASSEEHFKNLVARQLKRFLARGRQRTVVDNLLDRCKEITSSLPFRQGTETKIWWFELEETPADCRFPTSDEIAQISAELAIIPVQAPSSGNRASQVYTTPDLKRLLLLVAKRLACRLTVKDLDHIFRRLLTPWLPSFLGTDEGVLATQAQPSLSAEQEEMIRQAVHAIRQASTPLELEILAMKIADIPDSVVGRRFQISRPTVIKHKKNALTKVEAELAGLNEACQIHALELLASPGEEASDAP